MEKIWYCKKCKRLYKNDPGKRCHNGDRIHWTSVEMEPGYRALGYESLEEKKKKIASEFSIESVIEQFGKIEKKEPVVKKEVKKEPEFALTPKRKPPVLTELPTIKDEPVKIIKKEQPVKVKEVKVEVPVQKETPKFSFEPIYRKPEPMELKAEMEKLGLRKRKN